MSKSFVKTANTWYTIYVLNMMTAELLAEKDDQDDVDEKLSAILSQTIQHYTQIDKSVPFKLNDQTKRVLSVLKIKKSTIHD